MTNPLATARRVSSVSTIAGACPAPSLTAWVPGRLYAILLIMAALLMAPLASLAETEGRLSVMSVPAVEGRKGTQVAVNWSGDLPVRLEVGLETDEGRFVKTSPAVELTESMTLLPHPETEDGKSLTWRVTNGQAQTLARANAGSSQLAWKEGFARPGLDGMVEAATIYEGDLVVAGDFDTAGALTVNKIARWDGSEWSALSGPSETGVDWRIAALTVYDGDLIAGGNFTTAGGVAVNHIARWNGTEWSALGSGTDDEIFTLTVYDGDLIAGGFFTAAGGITANNIARWDGSEWSALAGPSGTGADLSVFALTVHAGDLFAGGAFTTIGGITANNIARWNGSEWSALSGPTATGADFPVDALTVYDGDLIAGGRFDKAGGVTANHIARWDGSEWSALSGPTGTGVDNTVDALTVYDGNLIAAGKFDTVGGVTVNHIVRWDGTDWSALSNTSGTGVSSYVMALTVYDDSLIAGGLFDETDGGLPVNRIAGWDGAEWSALSDSPGSGVNGEVNAVTTYDGDLIAAGNFTTAGESTVNHIARWNGTEWSALSGPSETGMDDWVLTLTVHDGDLIAGGDFTMAGGVTVNRIARWNGMEWAPLSGSSGSGANDTVQALIVHDEDLIVAGDFTTAGGVTVNRIARWDGNEWSALSGSSGTGIDDTIQALTVHDGHLIAGGRFTTAGGVTVNRIARWDGSEWSALSGPSGTGVDSNVLDLAVHGGDLIAAGFFETAGGVPVNHVARWNGAEWSALSGPSGTGIHDWVVALAVYGGDLIAGGFFTSAGGVPVNHVARWNGSEWSALSGPSGTGVDYWVFELSVHDGDLIAGGDFTAAGGVSSWNIARYGAVFNIGGSVSGLQGSGLILQNNGDDDLAISADGSFTFASAQDSGTPYEVTVLSQPTDLSQTCTVANGTGSVSGEDVSNVDVTCATDTFNIGGTVSGLEGSGLVLQNNGGDDLAISTDGSFSFATLLEDGSSYEVTVVTQPGTPNQACTVSNGTGSLSGEDISDIEVTCVDAFTIGGAVAGLEGSGLILQNNGGDELAISANGSFTFASAHADGSPYEVTVLSQPTDLNQTCTVANGTGTLSGEDVSNVEVTCVTDTFTIGGAVAGLEGSGLVLQNNGSDDLAISAAGSFTFSSAEEDGSPYEITVLSQPTDLSQTCTVANGTGTLSGEDVSSVEVTCVTNTFTIGGTISGLEGSGLVLQNNGGDDLAISANGSFAFATALEDGSPYEVTVLNQPSDPVQTCAVTNGSGTLSGENVTGIEVQCLPDGVFVDQFEQE